MDPVACESRMQKKKKDLPHVTVKQKCVGYAGDCREYAVHERMNIYQ